MERTDPERSVGPDEGGKRFAYFSATGKVGRPGRAKREVSEDAKIGLATKRNLGSPVSSRASPEIR